MHYEQPFHRCCPVQTPDRFGLFQRLPAEIRNMIWEYSLPESRVYEVLDAPNAKQKTQAQKGLMFANVHPEPPPALAAVCRESRYFVLHHYKPLTLGSTTKYVDLSRDILLLEPYLLVKRLHRTLHFMSQIPLVRDNINRLALGTSYGVYTGICHPVLSWKVSKNNMGKLLSTLAKFPKLKLLIFVVHQEFQFEFDYRFPGTLTPIPNHPPTGYLSSATPGPPNFGHGATSYPSPLNSHNSSRVGATLAPLASLAPTPRPVPPQSPTTTLTGYPSPITTGYPSPTNSVSSTPRPGPAQLPSGFPSPPPHHQYQHHHQAQQQQQSQSSTQQQPQPRPQLVHQAYRFKFDIEANINHTPRRPHLNELLYYPLDIDEDKEDWDLGDLGTEESEWCDPWPTNDDWRRFRKRFQRAINLSLEMGLAEGAADEGRVNTGGKTTKGKGGKEKDGWCVGGERRDGGGGGYWGERGAGGGGGKGEERRVQVPALKGASLLWRYQRV
ncbi:hypothetical protein QBC34DRAFT_130880 [Podospora aff. communis PSN243]|uniref:2EXR domain-containing protein n=1 Tax=Podospora aff. communis PSN243 TaxID=3040156 RepID=A0AAV9GJQ4_9PEZI|nr:hypothetical protein QBC34DRAFT_130880 [Podospora aff. communis PSN243]